MPNKQLPIQRDINGFYVVRGEFSHLLNMVAFLPIASVSYSSNSNHYYFTLTESESALIDKAEPLGFNISISGNMIYQ
jgi:hypothetical protein